MEIGKIIIIALISYLLGAIPAGMLISKLMGRIDITKYGSGNVGTANVTRTLGAKAGALVMVLDLGKAIVVMPRRGHLKETRNDHQFSTAREFRGKPGIFVADDETGLDAALDAALAPGGGAGGSAPPFAQERLIRFLAKQARG